MITGYRAVLACIRCSQDVACKLADVHRVRVTHVPLYLRMGCLKHSWALQTLIKELQENNQSLAPFNVDYVISIETTNTQFPAACSWLAQSDKLQDINFACLAGLTIHQNLAPSLLLWHLLTRHKNMFKLWMVWPIVIVPRLLKSFKFLLSVAFGWVTWQSLIKTDEPKILHSFFPRTFLRIPLVSCPYSKLVFLPGCSFSVNPFRARFATLIALLRACSIPQNSMHYRAGIYFVCYTYMWLSSDTCLLCLKCHLQPILCRTDSWACVHIWK